MTEGVIEGGFVAVTDSVVVGVGENVNVIGRAGVNVESFAGVKEEGVEVMSDGLPGLRAKMRENRIRMTIPTMPGIAYF